MRRRGGGRASLRAQRSGQFALRPWAELRNPLLPIKVLSDDEVETIHHASLKVLAEYGIKVLSARARSFYRSAGAAVDEASFMVRFDPSLVEQLVAGAPAEVRLHARNPERSITLGGNHINFAPVGGPSFVSDLEHGRRAGTFAELKDYMRLIHMLEVIHTQGAGSFAPLDLPVNTRHLDQVFAVLTLSDRVHTSSLLGRTRPRDTMKMAAIARGVKLEDLKDAPAIFGIININSPRQLDNSMAEGLIALAELGQPVVVTPFTLLGAMAPATLAGALVQQNAEALAGLALIQAVRPGAPMVYGGFTSNVDMKTGAPAFGTPEYTKACQAGGQLARRYGLPYRSSNTNASNTPDAQAAYESGMSLWGTVMGHANLVLHAAGWLEGGLTASFEKLIIDAEMLQMMTSYLEPITVDSDSLALDAISETPPGGHFFGAAHTLARYENAFNEPLVSDWRNFETWSEDGAKTAAERAHVIWKALLKQYEEPPLDPGIREELDAFVTRRKAEIGEVGDLP